MNTILLTILLLINIIWAALWYYRKTQTLEYAVNKFIRRKKMKPKLLQDTIRVSQDQMVQLFLRADNEHFRTYVQKDYGLNELLFQIDKYLKKDDDEKYILNGNSEYLIGIPKYIPIPKEYNLIEL
jgi:uncharacterized protein YxeA